MMIRSSVRDAARLVGLLSALMVALPAHAEPAPSARLVHCGQDTCLRLSGHRPRATDAIRVAGQDLIAAGGRNWVVTVPLGVARAWDQSDRGALALTLFNPQDRVERVENVLLPPGALGRHVELASLVIRAN